MPKPAPVGSLNASERHHGFYTDNGYWVSGTRRAITERWVSRIDKDAKAERNKKMLEMWMACYTHKEIASATGEARQTITDYLAENGHLSKIAQTPQALHQTKFKPPIYNIWK